MLKKIPHHGQEGSAVGSRKNNSNNEGPYQVEAWVVVEGHDIDALFHERVNQKVQERLGEERRFVATAKVVGPFQEKKVCNLPRKWFLGVVAITILVAAIAVGVSLGVIQSNSSSGTRAILFPTTL